MNIPFVHRFVSRGGLHYVYDVNTSRFLQVQPAVFDILGDCGFLDAEIISKWQHKYRRDDLKTAIAGVAVHERRGYFGENRFQQMRVPYDDDYLNEAVASQMGWLVLNITERCNLRCRYCAFSGTYRYERTHTDRMMERPVVARALKYYSEHSGKSQNRAVSFYGGEPLAAFENVAYAVNVLAEMGEVVNLHLDTNGLMLGNKEIVEFLVRHQINIQISLDGPEHCHDRHRRTVDDQPTWERTVANLKSLSDFDDRYYRECVCFAVTVAPDYDLTAMNEFFEKDEIVTGHGLLINWVRPFDTSFFGIFGQDQMKSARLQVDALRDQYVAARIAGREPTAFEKAMFDKPLITLHARKLDQSFEAITTNGCCIPGLRKVFVDVSGRFHPCERVGEAYDIGSVDTGLEISKMKKMTEEYIRGSEAACLGCWGAKLCGMCFSHARLGAGFSAERKQESCMAALDALHGRFVTYASILEANPHAFDFVKDVSFT